jgi:hypothetical protein
MTGTGKSYFLLPFCKLSIRSFSADTKTKTTKTNEQKEKSSNQFGCKSGNK